MIALLLACGPSYPAPEEVAWEGTAPYVTPLPAPRLLRRLSLDLRGVLPDEDDLDAVAADPAQLEALRDAWLDDPRLEERLVSMLAERWHTVLDTYEVGIGDYDLPPEQTDAFDHAVGEEPLRLIARVVVEDRPWTDVVTSDTTLANELLAGIWPLEREPGPGWQVARYTDGRPAAGVLATNGLWWRYVTNASNKSRGRVAAISSLLLCADILQRPVVFRRATGVDPEDAVRTDPSCVACHAAVDPAAASLFGFWRVIDYNAYELDTYHPEREPLGPLLLDTAPAWFGRPIAGLVELGDAVAEDPRFARCGAQSFAAQLWRREVTLEDFATVDALRQDFLAADLRVKPLIRAVTDTPEYRAGGFVAAAPDPVLDRVRTERLLTPNQLKTVLADEAGFTWTTQGYEQLENDSVGYRALRGGVNGYSATKVQQDPGLTWALVNTRAAEGAALALVTRDLLDGQGVTLRGVTLDTAPTDPAFAEALRSLHWRWYAEEADDLWLASITALWVALSGPQGRAAAWTAVVEAMLRDPRFQSY